MTSRRRQSRRAALYAAALWGIALGGSSTAGTPDPNRIVVKDFMFMPNSLTVKAGSAVTWANMDDEPHTVVSDAGLFRSGALDTGEGYTFTFAKPGTYHVVCSIHPRMTATVIVE